MPWQAAASRNRSGARGMLWRGDDVYDAGFGHLARNFHERAVVLFRTVFNVLYACYSILVNNERHKALFYTGGMPEDCLSGGGSSTTGSMDDECPPVILSWEGSADIQSGDILIVRIADAALLETSTTDIPRRTTEHNNATNNDGERIHRSPPQPAVYQVTRQGHEHCDVTDGMLLDIAPLAEQHDKLITLYDKDLTEGVNLLIGMRALHLRTRTHTYIVVETENNQKKQK
ncbi:hypothetical protein EVAR_16526_1 [Eumeta japonica]|uniref:Uncharacterized protein n=1 Tax=Eumeta variegata TaxID=151549 RepID=A0A4C1U3L9_EUMVA|nr:hypothetical protein EVAR_16526_1 [Eumeta japonica]